MGVEIKLTAKPPQVSPVIIDFLQDHTEGGMTNTSWRDQLNESLRTGGFVREEWQALEFP